MTEVSDKRIWQYLDFSWIAVIICGIPIVIGAIKALVYGKGFKGKVTSKLLITVAMLACLVMQFLIFAKVLKGEGHGHTYVFAAGEVAWLMAIGDILEDFTVGKARSGIENLVNLSPKTAKVITPNGTIDTPIEKIKKGDIVLVPAFDMISVDGVITKGETSVDQAVITGESLPIDKAVGDEVFGGTFNKEGDIEIRVTKENTDMTVNKLKKLVEEAEGKKAPINKVADKAAGFIIPSAIALAIIVFFINFIFMDKASFMADNISECVERGITMLIVFCPCAIALATPTAIAAALGNATKNGVLIKSGGAIEALAKADCVAFDKTGTLTTGKLRIDEFYDESDLPDLKSYVSALERSNSHPVAKALVAYCGETSLEAQGVKSLVGVGMTGCVDGRQFTIGKWPLNGNASDNLRRLAQKSLSQGKTVVALSKEDRICAIFALSDTIKEGAKDCMTALNKLGLTPLVLTGDNKAAAENALSGIVDADNIKSQLMPEDKLAVINQLRAEGKNVCMVGDGVNDAPALAASSCSVAMGALGSDAAIETADAALMHDNINAMPSLIKLSKKTVTKIKGNIAMSLVINIAAVILSIFGLLTPALGAFVHNFASILVVLNSVLLLGFKWFSRDKEDSPKPTSRA